MTLPKWATTVTPLSKTIALFIFITFPIFGFALGAYYQKSVDQTKNIIMTSPTPPQGQACTMEAKICPDGTAVGRTGPNCEFAPCPTGKINKITPTVSSTINCNTGDILNQNCPPGCVYYGMPLGCVTKEYYNNCQKTHQCPL